MNVFRNHPPSMHGVDFSKTVFQSTHSAAADEGLSKIDRPDIRVYMSHDVMTLVRLEANSLAKAPVSGPWKVVPSPRAQGHAMRKAERFLRCEVRGLVLEKIFQHTIPLHCASIPWRASHLAFSARISMMGLTVIEIGLVDWPLPVLAASPKKKTRRRRRS